MLRFNLHVAPVYIFQLWTPSSGEDGGYLADFMMSDSLEIRMHSNLPGNAKPSKTRNVPGPELDTRSQREPGRPVLTTDASPVHEDLDKLRRSHRARFWRLGELDDIQKAIEYGIRALALTPNDHPVLPRRHAALGISYGDRFQYLGDLEDNNKSIECYSRALASTPDGHPDLSNRHADLGISYRDRFRRLGDIDDLKKSIEHRVHALALTPDGHPELSRRHAALGVAYSDRFQCLGDREDNDKSIEYHSRALVLTPNNHPDLVDRLNNLGVAYSDRFRRLGDLEDNDKSINYYSRALALTPGGHPELSFRHANLGASYSDRFQRLGSLDDLEKAIEHKSHALAIIPDGHPELSLQYTNLGASYSDRFKRLGNLHDLEKAIEQFSRALSLTRDDHREVSLQHTNLGASYADRFRMLGEIDDLEKAIEHKSRALALTADGHPELSLRHNNLGASYSDRFRRLGNLGDLEKAIEQFSCALALTPNGHPDLPLRYTNLGVSYADRFRCLDELDDLEKAIEHEALSLALTPDGHPEMSRRYTDLGVSYSERFRRRGDPGDLEKAVEHESHALALTPDGHPALAERHFNRAHTFFLQFQHAGDSTYLEHSLGSFRRASQMSTGSPRQKFKYAFDWAELASKHSALNCIEAYQTVINILPQFIWLGATTNQRYHDLSTAKNLAGNAASVAILHSDPNLALEWLENARCVVWNQTLMLRSPVDELVSSHPGLAASLQEVAKKLNDAGSEPSELQAPSFDPEQVGKQRRRLANEYADLLAQARALPGYDDFLRPMKADRLVRVARNGPIAVINCHEDRCDALLIIPGQGDIKHLSLPNFTAKRALNARDELLASLRRKGIRERGVKVLQPPGYKDSFADVLLSLWNDIVKPVLDFLGFTNNISTDLLPHITWCPTGAMSFLPLHAAGDYNQPHSRVFNYIVSSYTPTLTALLASASSLSNSTSRILAIGQTNTLGRAPLPGVVEELACVKAHSQNQAGYSELIDDQATTTNVLDGMEQHDWVHLACHAHQNVVNPTKSGFFLHGGTLDLASITRRSFKNKGLAFLSACQTATGDEKLPDEAIHLASGMLMAGYPSVIATMWSVIDKDAPLVADRVYAELMKDVKVGNGEAGRALHNAVAVLREEVGEKEFARWVPYIHMGS